MAPVVSHDRDTRTGVLYTGGNLGPGDELIFPSISRAELEKIEASDTNGQGGSDSEALK